jgi:A/G-specific adenine glycosylase
MRTEVESTWSRSERATLRRKLMRWYGGSARSLPWRASGDPYCVWLSEIMLQQTTVAAVIPYYERFLRRFPNVRALAAADEQAVLSEWEGLGYYSRARNLHRAATIVADELGGRFPDTVEGLLRLPGVGRYTAGAIVSFAFNRPAPIVEANTLRLYARLIGYEGDPRSAAGQARLWEFAESILPASDARDFNQALMDLGATVCTVSAPRCGECPLKSLCRAFLAGRQREIPPPRSRPDVTTLFEVAFAIRHDDRWLVRRRPADERWGGLWDFPRVQTDEATWSDRPTAKSLRVDLSRLADETDVRASEPIELADSSYSFTRYRVRLRRIVARFAGGESGRTANAAFVTEQELGELPLTRSARQFVDDLFEARHLWEPDDRVFRLNNRPRRRPKARKV